MTYAAFNYVDFHNAKNEAGESGGEGAGELKVRYASDRFAYAVKLAISGGGGDGIDGSTRGLEFSLPDSSGIQPRFVRIRDYANSSARELFEQSGITLKSRT